MPAKDQEKTPSIFAKVFAWEPWNSDVIYKIGKLEKRAALEAERVNYNGLCKLLLGYADEWGCRENGRDYNNLHLLLSTDDVPGLCVAVCVCHRLLSAALGLYDLLFHEEK